MNAECRRWLCLENTGDDAGLLSLPQRRTWVWIRDSERASEKEQGHRAISCEERLKLLDLFTSKKG